MSGARLHAGLSVKTQYDEFVRIRTRLIEVRIKLAAVQNEAAFVAHSTGKPQVQLDTRRCSSLFRAIDDLLRAMEATRHLSPDVNSRFEQEVIRLDCDVVDITPEFL
jgi:hypothetical protein